MVCPKSHSQSKTLVEFEPSSSDFKAFLSNYIDYYDSKAGIMSKHLTTGSQKNKKNICIINIFSRTFLNLDNQQNNKSSPDL